ncbi:hypothetical protein [Xanthomarina spongicola]|uniref:Uncharacterized protein n=1 Tax=Xanthomarina spongicola TaxID=570520 RepID=A0A316DQZ9_9FLAO|nr:hypothetical protein [Xanthomarina spongicola]PWK20677.1 hypothetical protein LX78_00379 [Xanthomarina spongicola]
MKTYILLLVVFVSGNLVAQDSTSIEVETPKIISKLQLGKTYSLDTVQIKFVDVLSDSRCPSDVTCVWAGQVIALVEVYENKTLIEKKELVFESGKNINNELMTLFTSEKSIIIANNVLPYPKSREKIKKEDYYLQLEVK